MLRLIPLLYLRVLLAELTLIAWFFHTIVLFILFLFSGYSSVVPEESN
jgi:hypothetical protein